MAVGDRRARGEGRGRLARSARSKPMPARRDGRRPGRAGDPVVLHRGPSTGNQVLPADGRIFPRSERIRLEMEAAPGAPVWTGALLDRNGTKTAVPVVAGERTDAATGQRWLTADITLAPLGAGDYVVELSTVKGTETQKIARRDSRRAIALCRRGLEMTVVRAIVLGAAVILAQAVAAPQPPPPQQPQQPPPRFRAGANLVRVDVYATKDGVPVQDLTAADLEITEDKAPQKIESFEHIAVRRGQAGVGGRRTLIAVPGAAARGRSQAARVRDFPRHAPRALRGLARHQRAAHRLHAAGAGRGGSDRADDARHEPRPADLRIQDDGDRGGLRETGILGPPRLADARRDGEGVRPVLSVAPDGTGAGLRGREGDDPAPA